MSKQSCILPFGYINLKNKENLLFLHRIRRRKRERAPIITHVPLASLVTHCPFTQEEDGGWRRKKVFSFFLFLSARINNVFSTCCFVSVYFFKDTQVMHRTSVAIDYYLKYFIKSTRRNMYQSTCLLFCPS